MVINSKTQWDSVEEVRYPSWAFKYPLMSKMEQSVLIVLQGASYHSDGHFWLLLEMAKIVGGE